MKQQRGRRLGATYAIASTMVRPPARASEKKRKRRFFPPGAPAAKTIFRAGILYPRFGKHHSSVPPKSLPAKQAGNRQKTLGAGDRPTAKSSRRPASLQRQAGLLQRGVADKTFGKAQGPRLACERKPSAGKKARSSSANHDDSPKKRKKLSPREPQFKQYFLPLLRFPARGRFRNPNER